MSRTQFALHGDDAATGQLADCFVELHIDGSVVLVVDGERLFRFPSLDALLGQYALVTGERTASSDGEPSAGSRELAAAELAVTIAVDAIKSQPRAEKILLDPIVRKAIERVRLAREQLR
jgi:hypothetical protein